MRVPEATIRGDVDDGYGPVADAFRANFEHRGEVGAACAIYRDSQKVVDIWGGFRNGKQLTPWQQDTMLLVFSASKGMAAAAMAIAHSQRLFGYEDRVAEIWPEFARGGKEEVTVRELLSHRAGVPKLDERVSLARLRDTEWLSRALADQAPSWTPGTDHGYHGVTLGWYQSEMLRRLDPEGRRMGKFFAEQVADRLGVDFYFGLPDSVDERRLAYIHAYGPLAMLLNLNKMPRAMLTGMLNPAGLGHQVMRTLPDLVKERKINRREMLALEAPSVLGVGEARAMARVYGSMATGGGELGLQADTLRELEKPAPWGRDRVLKVDTCFSLGFIKPFPGFGFGTSDRAYGAPGGGGSFGMADPDAGIGYAYAMNRLGFHFPADPRERAVRSAFYEVIGERAQ